MEQNNEATSEILLKFSKMNSTDIQLLYEQYSEWSRHLHSEILTIATFGLTISLGSITFAFGTSISSAQIFVLGFLNLLFLFICHSFIESIKNQQTNFWAVLDNIEVNWGIRNKEFNMFGPLIRVSSKFRPDATGKQRRLLFK